MEMNSVVCMIGGQGGYKWPRSDMGSELNLGEREPPRIQLRSRFRPGALVATLVVEVTSLMIESCDAHTVVPIQKKKVEPAERLKGFSISRTVNRGFNNTDRPDLS